MDTCTRDMLEQALVGSRAPVYEAGDLLRMLKFRNVDSHHPCYRAALSVLNGQVTRGLMGRRHFAATGQTVFYWIS